MKAAAVTRYGPPEVVEIREVPKPAPRENEILIQVHAATVSSGDWRMRSLTLPPGFGAFGRLAFGFLKPRNPVGGNDLSGVVKAVGSKVTHFKPGDAVIAQCGMGMGAHAEFKVLPEDGAIAHKPGKLSFTEAAAMGFGGGTALHFLKKTGIKRGDRLLVNGASGSVGSAMVQLGRHFGAEVTAVASGRNAGMLRALGADHVIDYTKEDFTQNGETYDIIADTAGTAPFSRSGVSIKPGGHMLAILGGLGDLIGAGRASRRTGKSIIAGPARESAAGLDELSAIADGGGFTPYIEAVYPLDQIVEAHRLVETGHKRGNVVVTMPVMAQGATEA
jgi:NADPH:quinone reductase-like Zn-dependent oxidoreductase